MNSPPMHEEWKARSRAVWSKGDYAPASRQLEPAAESLVEALGVGAGMRVLDVAAGHGNCTMAAARRGADVIATDFSPTMIAVGSERTRAAQLDIPWQEADAADLPFENASFDRVTSTFGAIFAPEQEQVAAELSRVTRPGGKVGLTAWTPDGLTARMLAVRARSGPSLPPDAPDPFRWGAPDEVTALFAAHGCDVQIRRRALSFRYDSWDHWRHDSQAHGLAVVARETMEPAEYDEMLAAIQAATAEYDRGEGDAVVFDSDYLEIVATKLM